MTRINFINIVGGDNMGNAFRWITVFLLMVVALAFMFYTLGFVLQRL
jgi:hypothetical protein